MKKSPTVPSLTVSRICILISIALTPTLAVAAQDTHCNVDQTFPAYLYVAGDVSDARHLQLTRSFGRSETLDITICAGDVRILASTDDRFHLNVELKKAAPGSITGFIERLDSEAGSSRISLNYPKRLKPFVVLSLPHVAQVHSEINLGTGTLSIAVMSSRGTGRSILELGR